MRFLGQKALIVAVVMFMYALCSCDDGEPSQHELERRAISRYTRDVSSFTNEMSKNLNSIEWAKRKSRYVKKGKTWVFTSYNGVIKFDSTLNYYLPDNLRGHNLADVRTVVIIRGEPKVVGYYGSQNGSDRVDAIQYDRSITFVDTETMKIVKEISSEGGMPPTSIKYRSGNKPEQASGSVYSPDEIILILNQHLL